MLKSKILFPLYLLAAGLVVAACGGGDGTVAGGGIGGTGITASGSITGFGSIKLNGLVLDTTNATRIVDGVPAADDSALAVGMVVTVKGILNADGVNGTAGQIVYDDDVQGQIQGPIDEIDRTKSFSVMGIQVDVDRIATVFANTDYGSLASGDLVELSGFFDGAGILHASRIEKKGGSLVEVKGDIIRFGPLGRTFQLDVRNGAVEFTVDYTAITLPARLSSGEFVEVKGTLANTTIAATQVTRVDEGFDSNVDNASIEGIVSGFATGGIGDFLVAGQQVDASAASFSPPALATSIADGIQVEVDGPIVNGVLQALGVESRGGNIEIGAVLESVLSDPGDTTGSITLQLFPGSLDLQVDSRTTLRDNTGAVDPLTLADLVPMSDYLEVDAYRDDASGDLIVTELRRDDLEDDELQGPVDSCDGVTVSILGLGYVLDDATTSYTDENEGTIATAAAFCSQQAAGGFLVKVVDKLPGDGTADEAELEN